MKNKSDQTNLNSLCDRVTGPVVKKKAIDKIFISARLLILFYMTLIREQQSRIESLLLEHGCATARKVTLRQ